jgi:LysR family cyn operon transcriptional activator
MELRHVRYFLAVADALHFTKAAESVHVSQPALSAQIKQLEEEMGTPLFDRVGRRIHLTRAGRIFQDHARRVLHEIEAARVAIDEMEGLQPGTLVIGALQTVNASLIPEIVARFSDAHPGIVLKVEELSGPDIEEGVTGGRLDTGIGFLPPVSGKLEAELLFEDDLVLIAPPRHRLTKRRRVATRDLRREPLVLLSTAFYARRLLDDSFQAAGVTPMVAVEMNSIEVILATVQKGTLATVLPRLSLGKNQATQLKAIALTNPTTRRQVGLLWRKGSYRNGAARVLVDQVKAVVKEYWR